MFAVAKVFALLLSEPEPCKEDNYEFAEANEFVEAKGVGPCKNYPFLSPSLAHFPWLINR